ncbi:MAG: VOC family protein [Verrucomicrobiota bacterium]
MLVEKLKYTLWAADRERARDFYCGLFGGQVVRENSAVTEIEIAGSTLSLHGGGEGKRTWTGLTFQIADVVAGAARVRAAGGHCPREPQPENGQPPHLYQPPEFTGRMEGRRCGEEALKRGEGRAGVFRASPASLLGYGACTAPSSRLGLARNPLGHSTSQFCSLVLAMCIDTEGNDFMLSRQRDKKSSASP